jgi:hypothetical protein
MGENPPALKLRRMKVEGFLDGVKSKILLILNKSGPTKWKLKIDSLIIFLIGSRSLPIHLWFVSAQILNKIKYEKSGSHCYFRQECHFINLVINALKIKFRRKRALRLIIITPILKHFFK